MVVKTAWGGEDDVGTQVAQLTVLVHGHATTKGGVASHAATHLLKHLCRLQGELTPWHDDDGLDVVDGGVHGADKRQEVSKGFACACGRQNDDAWLVRSKALAVAFCMALSVLMPSFLYISLLSIFLLYYFFYLVKLFSHVQIEIDGVKG